VTLVTILAAIVALCVVIIIHEFGHYIAAVWTGMKVDRFSVFGIGPPILKLGTWRDTEFVVSAIPFGAYVLIRGMEADDGTSTAEDRASSQNFRDKPLLSRIIVIAGGPIANYVGAIALFFGLFALAGMPGPAEQATAIEVLDVTKDSAAATAGVQEGDRLLAIGDTAIDPTRGSEGVVLASQAHRGTDAVILVERDGQRLELPATLPDKDEGVLGIRMEVLAPRQAVPVGEAARAAVLGPFLVSKAQLVGHQGSGRSRPAEVHRDGGDHQHAARALQSPAAAGPRRWPPRVPRVRGRHAPPREPADRGDGARLRHGRAARADPLRDDR
jgi:regulator of sigma E protease